MQKNATVLDAGVMRVSTPVKKTSLRRKMLLVLEFCIVCLLIPTVIIAFRLAPQMFLFLWSVSIFCWVILHRKDEEFWVKKWNWKAVNKENLKIIIPRWIVASVAMVLFLYVIDPDRMFSLFYERPQFIPFFLMIYPALSAFPQELIFCGYFFERFSPLFKNQRTLIIVSALVFAYAHILYINWVAPLLSIIAGFIFASTYAKTHSLSLVTIEHSLYGISLFLIGLGWYFYGGSLSG